jgi:hypothetical protein
MRAFIICFETVDKRIIIVNGTSYTTESNAWKAFCKAAKLYFKEDGALLIDKSLHSTPWGYWIKKDNETLYCETITINE